LASLAALVATVVLTGATPAWADVAAPPRRVRTVVRCHAQRLQQPGEECVVCLSSTQNPERCVVPLQHYAFTRRCRETRRVATEVWCRALMADAPKVPAEVGRVLTKPFLPIVLPPDPLPAPDAPPTVEVPAPPNPPLPPLRTDDGQPTPMIPAAPEPPPDPNTPTTTVLSEDTGKPEPEAAQPTPKPAQPGESTGQ